MPRDNVYDLTKHNFVEAFVHFPRKRLLAGRITTSVRFTAKQHVQLKRAKSAAA